MSKPDIPITYMSAAPFRGEHFTLGELEFFIRNAVDNGFGRDDEVTWLHDEHFLKDRITVQR